MNGSFSSTLTTGWLDQVASLGQYVSLHFEVPSWADPGASEVFDFGYARANTGWSDSSAYAITNTLPLVFAVTSQTSVAAVGVWSALTAGTMLLYAVPTSEAVLRLNSAGRLTIPIGEINIGFAPA